MKDLLLKGRYLFPVDCLHVPFRPIAEVVPVNALDGRKVLRAQLAGFELALLLLQVFLKLVFKLPFEPRRVGELRDLTAELQRQAKQAMESAAAQAAEGIRRTAEESEQRNLSTAEEFFQRWKENLHQAQEDARTGFSAHLSAKQEEFLTELRSQFEQRFSEAGQVLDELDQKTRIAREAESELAGQVERLASPASSAGPPANTRTTPRPRRSAGTSASPSS